MALSPRLVLVALALAVPDPASGASPGGRPATQPPDAPIKVFFGPRAADDPGGPFHGLLGFLDTAKTSIYGSAHEIDMIAVAEKLAQRAAQGLDVQLVIESRWMALPKDTAAFAILQKSKVKIIPDTKKSGLMHNKFFIVDGKRVWTGSTNLTEHCLFFNPNNAVWIEDARVAEDFLTEFHEEREGRFGRKGSGPANTPYPTVTIGNATVSVYFSPEDSPTPAIVAMIGRAEKTVDVMSFVFSSLPIGEALVAAKKRGVRVRVLLDNAFSSEGATARWKYVPFAELSKAGIACKYDDEQSKLHHKVIVVDSREVLTGSFNLSANAENTNDENLVIIASADIGARFQAEFDRLWSFFSGDPGKAPAPDAEDRHLGSADGKEKE